MRLAYRSDDKICYHEIGDRPITIGRSPDADIVIKDEKASRLHCGVSMMDSDFILKDLSSKNGTFLNGDKIDDTAPIQVGDRFRVGDAVFVLEDEESPGTETVLQEVEHELAHGKGYKTMLREIVEDADN